MQDERLVISPKRPKGDDGYRTFSIRIKEELVERINAVSAETGYSRNELIARFLEYAVERCVIAGGKKEEEGR